MLAPIDKTADAPNIAGEAWKTQDRKAVEAVLHSAAATGSALTPHQIASYSNVELSAARAIIKTLVTAKFAINIGTAQQPRYRRRTEAHTGVSYQRDWGRYIPSTFRPSDARPKCEDAFLLPSLVNGKEVPAKRPVAQCVGVLADRSTIARG